jgi:HAMP domain-containing protein
VHNNLQAYELTRGFSGQYLANQLLGTAKANIERATRRIEKIAQNLTEGESKTNMNLLALRLKTLNCVIGNAINTITYAYYLEITDKTKKPGENTEWHVPTDWRLKDLQVITRAEIDNTYELIRILESTDKPLLSQTKIKTQEDVFLFGPDLINQLKKKAEIMLNHQMDYNRLYIRSN